MRTKSIFASIVLLLLPVGDANADGTLKATGEVTHTQGQKIATKAFLKSNPPYAKNYLLTSVVDEKEETYWIYLFRGTGRYERPGFHTMVTVEKASGKVKVVPGE